VRLARLEDRITWHESTLPSEIAQYYIPNGPQYKGDHYNKPSETKTAGWIKPSEHPEGMLGKPCEVCGYKYGTAWLREEVPQDVLDFLVSLPAATGTPAWV